MASGLLKEAQERVFGEEFLRLHGFRFRVPGSSSVAHDAALHVARQQLDTQRIERRADDGDFVEND